MDESKNRKVHFSDENIYIGDLLENLEKIEKTKTIPEKPKLNKKEDCFTSSEFKVDLSNRINDYKLEKIYDSRIKENIE